MPEVEMYEKHIDEAIKMIELTWQKNAMRYSFGRGGRKAHQDKETARQFSTTPETIRRLRARVKRYTRNLKSEVDQASQVG